MTRSSRHHLLRFLTFSSLSLHFLGASALFSVHDDLLAFPQFQIQFPDAYATEEEAEERLAYMSTLSSMSSSKKVPQSPTPLAGQPGEHEQTDIPLEAAAVAQDEQQQQLQRQRQQQQQRDKQQQQQGDDGSVDTYGEVEKPNLAIPRWDSGNMGDALGRIGAMGDGGSVGSGALSGEARMRHGFREGIEITWDAMWLGDKRYLCSIPVVKPPPKLNATEKRKSKDDEEKELARATARGLELLKGMEGNCIYFISGWWSYSFCHNDKIRQFHQVPPTNGVPMIPPVEDNQTPAYILGRAPSVPEVQELHKGKEIGAEIQTNGELKYLVQKLDGGTKCDITGKDRRIEVQFHCQPYLSHDKIGYIKEVTTCCYLMVVYTRRLCEDQAFLPPKQDRAHGVECREIMTAKQIEEYRAANQRKAIEKEERIMKFLADSGINAVGAQGKGGASDGSPGGKGSLESKLAAEVKKIISDVANGKKGDKDAASGDEKDGKVKDGDADPTIVIVRAEDEP